MTNSAGTAWGHNYSQIKVFHSNLLSAPFFKAEKINFLRKFDDDQYHNTDHLRWKQKKKNHNTQISKYAITECFKNTRLSNQHNIQTYNGNILFHLSFKWLLYISMCVYVSVIIWNPHHYKPGVSCCPSTKSVCNSQAFTSN